MISKILFTAAVIALVYLVARHRGAAGQSGVPTRRQGQAPVSTPVDTRVPRYLAYGLLGIMLAGSSVFVFLEWRDQYRVVNVRVVNTNTGQGVDYRARRGDVQDRSFETLDGRRVVLAAVERLEMGGPE